MVELLAFGVTVSIVIGNFAVLFSRTTWKVKLIFKKRELKKQAKLGRETRLRIFKTNRIEPEPNDIIPTDRTDRWLINYFTPDHTGELTNAFTPDRTTPGTRSHHLNDYDLDDAFEIE